MRRPGQLGYHAWVLLAPALLLLGLFVVWPLSRAVIWSFQNVGILNPSDTQPVGWENYAWMISDPRFRQAYANTALFALMVVPIQTVLSFFVALWVDRPHPAWRWLRHAFFVPVIVSMPVLAVLWTMLYQPLEGEQMGFINRLVTSLGFPDRDWLGNPSTALPAIAVLSVWQGLGFQMMIFLAGLQNLGKDQLEAARIDGATPLQRLWHVILPGMKPSVVFVVLTTTILSFRLFVQPYLMTRGGPENRTVSIIQFIYETTFLNRDLGLAGAGTVIFLLSIIVPLLVLRYFRRTPA